LSKLDFELIGYRTVPVDETVPGSGALEVMPNIEQLFVKHKKGSLGLSWSVSFNILRNFSSSEINTKIPGVNHSFYFASLSSQTLILQRATPYRSGFTIL